MEWKCREVEIWELRVQGCFWWRPMVLYVIIPLNLQQNIKKLWEWFYGIKTCDLQRLLTCRWSNAVSWSWRGNISSPGETQSSYGECVAPLVCAQHLKGTRNTHGKHTTQGKRATPKENTQHRLQINFWVPSWSPNSAHDKWLEISFSWLHNGPIKH